MSESPEREDGMTSDDLRAWMLEYRDASHPWTLVHDHPEKVAERAYRSRRRALYLEAQMNKTSALEIALKAAEAKADSLSVALVAMTRMVEEARALIVSRDGPLYVDATGPGQRPGDKRLSNEAMQWCGAANMLLKLAEEQARLSTPSREEGRGS